MARLILLCAFLSCPCFASTDDDFQKTLGTWKLNVQKSKVQGQSLASGEMKTERIAPATIRTEMNSVTVIGEKQQRVAVRVCDGKEHSPEGSTGKVTYVCTPDGIVTKRGGAIFSEVKAVFSTDGQTQSVELKLLNSEGKWVEQVMVYQKQ